MNPQLKFYRNACCAFALCLFSVTSLFAQEQQTGAEKSLKPKFGIKAGVNLSNLYVNNVQDENMKVGLNAGLIAKLPVTRGFSIQPELLYSSKGAKETYNNLLEGNGEYRFNLNYIELPVSAVFNIVKNFNLHAGGYVSYLASANVKRLSGDGDVSTITDLNTENFNRIDYGLIAGLGVDVQNFTIGARYNYGLREIGKSGLAGDITKNSKNSVIGIYLGFGF